jgi:hypothetical protein
MNITRHGRGHVNLKNMDTVTHRHGRRGQGHGLGHRHGRRHA